VQTHVIHYGFAPLAPAAYAMVSAGTPADAWIANLVVCMSTGAHSEDQAARRVWLTEEQAPERGRAAVHERDHFYSF
jgi:hypothetical protein